MSLSAYSPQRTLTRVDRTDEYEAEQRPLDIGLITRLFRYTKGHAVTRNWLFVLVLIRAVQLPLLTWLIAVTIRGPISAGDVTGVIWCMITFFLLALSTQVVMHFRQRLALNLGEAVVFDLRRDLFQHLQIMPMAFFHRTKLGRIISRMSSDIEDVRIGVQEVLFVCLVQVGQMIFAAAFMLYYDVRLFLMVALLVPGIWVLNRIFHRRLSDNLRRMRDSFSRVTATLAESVNGIRVTQGYVRQETNARMFRELLSDHARYNYEYSRTQGIFLPLLDLNNQLFTGALLIVGAWRVFAVDATIAVGDLVGFFFMAHMLFGPITILGNQYNQALTSMAGAERVFKLLDTPPDWIDDPTAGEHILHAGMVEFRNITFGYDPDRPVLREIEFTAAPGQMIALVGHTGSGKTSLINLLAKFYLPQQGSILLDGRDIRSITGESLHRQVAIVLQQNFLFTGSIADNIRYGKPDATDEEILDVLASLECRDMILSLPQGLQTPVGERGGLLSLGQRQIVCFGRAMIAAPRILILDEATSSVDAVTESRLQRALELLLRGRTSFVIAHRLSTIRHADLILMLEHGRIIERGDHQQLLSQSGAYSRLYRRFAAAAVGE